MDNNTLVALGAVGFFDRFPVPDLMPSLRIVQPSWFARQKAKLLHQTPPVPQPKSRLKSPMHQDPGAGPNDLKVIDSDHRIQFLDVSAPTGNGLHHSLAALDCPGASRLPVCIRLRSRPAHTSIATYYLPYQLNEHRRVTLVDKQGVGGVDLFLTDIVDGCSVYVEGTREEPTVSHLNANALPLAPKAQPVQRKADWHGKTQQMNQRFTNAAPPKRVAANDPNLVAARRVDFKHYGMRFATDEAAFIGTLAALQGANRAPVTVGGVPVATMSLLHTAGTIFGVKVLNQWSFHVQRRALVAYDDAGGHPLALQWMIRDVQQFWPAAGATTGKAA